MQNTYKMGHLELIRKLNMSLILDTIKEKQPISRAQIAKILNLSKTTVGSAVDEMIAKKLIVEYSETGSTTGAGRPSMMLSFNPKSAYCIGMDIGGTKILTIITDLAGSIIYEKKVPTTNKMEELFALVDQSIAEVGLKEDMIFGLGIGVPGTVLPSGNVVRAKALKWNNLPLQEIFNEHYSFPVCVGNDVNLAAMGERWLGSGGKADEMVFISIGTGIGCAVISNGQLLYGHEGRCGEIGYYLESEDVKSGHVNQLGKPGVFETKCSGSALDSETGAAEDLLRAYSRGEDAAIVRVDRYILDLSVAIANTVSLLNPSKVVIGGGVADSLGAAVPRIREEVARLTPLSADVCLASLGCKAGALGAIAFALVQIEQQDLKVR